MVREFAISLYLLIFRIFFYTFRLFPQKKKTTFVTSFGDNVLYTVKEVEKQTDDRIVILKTSQCRVNFEVDERRTVLLFEVSRPLDWMRSVFHLATSRLIFIDNYFGFLAVTRFRPGVRCVQLWHAAGAVKQFGLNDPSNSDRSTRAVRRFKQVYDRFDHVVVGSEKMADIFKDSFGLSDDRMLRTGIPRTDFFYDLEGMEQVAWELARRYSEIGNKKVILYAPTYRGDALSSADLALDIRALHRALGNEYVLMLRLHPAIQGDFDNRYPGFVIDVTDYPDIHHLLAVTDLLVTDYSSIPFEFALLGRPMVFFAYDLEEYAVARGFTDEFEEMVPGPVVRTTRELSDVVQNDQFDLGRVQAFAEEWNEYSVGGSSKRLIERLYDQERGVL